MQPELRHLRYLQAVAAHGNFTRAAQDLHVSQPTLSQQIQQLERGIGAQLLDRSGRSVRLTDAGQAYLEHAQRALRELAAGQRAVHDVTDLSRGHLRLAVTPTFTAYLVAPLIAELHHHHPGITVTVREMSQESMENKLLADELDLGVAFDQPHLQGVRATTLFTETLIAVAGASSTVERLTAKTVEHQPLALITTDFATRDHIDAYFTQHRIAPRIVLEANSIQALIEIVRHTSLVTVLPDAIAARHLQLRPVPLEPPLPTRTVTLLAHDGTYQTAAARAFARLTREYLSRVMPQR